MAIAYDALNNKIVVTGAETPLFANIYAADLAGGWDVVTRQGDNQYYFTCHLQIGDGVTVTICSDIQQQVEIGTNAAPRHMTVTANATLTLGTPTDPQDGGSLKIWGGSGVPAAPNVGRWYGTYNFYGLSFIKLTVNWLLLYGTATWVNVVLSGVLARVAWRQFAASTFTRCSFAFMELQTSLITFRNCLFQRSHAFSEAFRFSGGFNALLEDSEIANVGAGPEVNHWGTFTATANIIDCVTDESRWQWQAGANGITNRRWTINVEIVERLTGNPIAGATVTLIDSLGVVRFALLTNAAGQIAEQTETQHRYTGVGVLTDYDPFTLRIEAPGFKTYEIQFDLDEPIDWRIALCRIVDVIFVDDRVALNLDEENPESELYTQI